MPAIAAAAFTSTLTIAPSEIFALVTLPSTSFAAVTVPSLGVPIRTGEAKSMPKKSNPAVGGEAKEIVLPLIVYAVPAS